MGWVGLGQSADGLSWIGSHKMDPWTTVMCVCLSAIISPQLHVRSAPNLLYVLPIAMAGSSSGGELIRYVLPVLWMTA